MDEATWKVQLEDDKEVMEEAAKEYEQERVWEREQMPFIKDAAFEIKLFEHEFVGCPDFHKG